MGGVAIAVMFQMILLPHSSLPVAAHHPVTPASQAVTCADVLPTAAGPSASTPCAPTTHDPVAHRPAPPHHPRLPPTPSVDTAHAIPGPPGNPFRSSATPGAPYRIRSMHDSHSQVSFHCAGHRWPEPAGFTGCAGWGRTVLLAPRASAVRCCAVPRCAVSAGGAWTGSLRTPRSLLSDRPDVLALSTLVISTVPDTGPFFPDFFAAAASCAAYRAGMTPPYSSSACGGSGTE